MNAAPVESNPYELLELKYEANEQEIRTAYRQRSLKVHPDRNRNNPDAARKFHELNQAYELLLDPLRRLALDASLRLARARAERYKSYDAKRKNLVEELEERERAVKKARVERAQEERQRWEEEEKIKEEGRKLREDWGKKQDAGLRAEKERQRDKEEEAAPPALDPLDTTIRIKYTLSAHPDLTTRSAIAAFLRAFGETDEDSIVLSLKAKKVKKSKSKSKSEQDEMIGTALAPFKQIGNAFAAVCASGLKERGMDGIDIGWVGGKEPAVVIWLKKMGRIGNTASKLSAGATSNLGAHGGRIPVTENRARDGPVADDGAEDDTAGSPYSTFPSSFPSSFPETPHAPIVGGLDYESLTLMRLRQAERERLEREIREREEAGDE